MDPASYRNWEVITPGATVNALIRRTKAIMIIGTAGALVVGGTNTGTGHDGAVVNFGTVASGTILPLEVTTVGSANASTIVAMR